MVLRSLHIGFALCLVFLYTVQEEERVPVRRIYLGLVAVSIAVSVYILFEAGKMESRIPWLRLSDYIVGVLLIAAYKATGI